MSAEKTAVLVVSGVIAILLALTLARSRTDESMDGSAGTVTWEHEDRPIDAGEVSLPPRRDPDPDPGLRRDPPPRAPRTYVVRPGDTFGGIAARVLGSRALSAALQEANPDVHPRKLRIGMKIRLPDMDARRLVKDRGAPPGRGAEIGPATPRWHRVRSGERLETIARHYYGKRSAWRRIYAANRDRLRSPHRVPEGARLRVP